MFNGKTCSYFQDTISLSSKGAFLHYLINWEPKNNVSFGHMEVWRPLATDLGICDFKDILSFRPQHHFAAFDREIQSIN